MEGGAFFPKNSQGKSQKLYNKKVAIKVEEQT